MISVFGHGFIGQNWINKYPNISYTEPRESLSPKFDDILYFIGSNTNYNMFDSLQKDIEDNLVKLNKILENCKDRNINITFISSWFCYGMIKDLPAKEEDNGEVFGYYSICKKAAEQMLITFCKVYDKKYKIIRLANVYGPGDVFSVKKNALTYLVKKIQNNEDIDLYWGGDVIRDYIYVDDVCNGIKLVMDRGGEDSVYNLGSGVGTKMGDILSYIKELTGSTSQFNTIQPSKFHQIVQNRHFYMDISKIKKLGFNPQYDIYNGIKTIL